MLNRHLGGGTECTLSKFAEDTKLGEEADTPDGCVSQIQWDLDRMKALQYLYWGSQYKRHGDTTVSPAMGHYQRLRACSIWSARGG